MGTELNEKTDEEGANPDSPKKSKLPQVLTDLDGLVTKGPMEPINPGEARNNGEIAEKLAKSLSPVKNPLPPNFTDFDGLMAAVPLGPRTLREEIKKGRIPTIRLPGGRRLLFHLPSVERALLRFQRGGIE